MPARAAETARTAARDLVLTRVFDAPRSLVWEAWTTPAHLAQWWGPHEFSSPRAEMELRPGGPLHIDMRGPDGRVQPVTGEVREAIAPERLVFVTRLTDARGDIFVEVLNTVTLREQDGRTALRLEARVLRAAAEAAGPLSGMEEGWSQSLDKLASDVATRAAERDMVVTRVVDAPRDLVWQVWTDPEHVGRWWGPHGFSTTTRSHDLRPGGSWVHVMHGPDGVDYPNHTTFHEVTPPERLVYTNRGGEDGPAPVAFEATVTFDAMGPRTRVTLRARFASAEARSHILRTFGAYEGAHQTLNRLARHLGSCRRKDTAAQG